MTSIVLACVTLYTIIKTCYNPDNQGLTDEKDNNKRDIPGAWRQGQVYADLGGAQWENNTTVTAKRQRLYCKNYYNNPVGVVPWQNDNI